jgi:sugar (pentulose or hexulose) kinase
VHSLKKVLVGIDVGTTSVKAVVTDLDLNFLIVDSFSTPWVHNDNNSEIDMDLLASQTIELASRVVEKAGGVAASIGITGFSETGALLGADLKPLISGYAWHDPRSDSEKLRSEIGDELFQKTTGAPITPVPTIGKILWQQNNFENARKPKHFIGAPEYILFKLCGVLVNEYSLISRSGFLDISRKSPWLQGIELIGGGSDFLAKLVHAGEPIGVANSDAPENLRGAVLAVAGHDHQTAAYHMGSITDGALYDSMGTAEAIVRTFQGTLSPEAMSRLADEGINVGWSPIPDHQIILCGLPTGITLERISSMLGATSREKRFELGEAALSADLSHHTISVDGSYTDLNISHISDGLTPAHIWRAAVESLNEKFVHALTHINRETGVQTSVTISGGWINNPMVREIKHKLFGEFTIPEIPEPGAMGAAELGGVAGGTIKRRW